DYSKPTISLLNVALEYSRAEHVSAQICRDMDTLLTDQGENLPVQVVSLACLALALGEHRRAEYVPYAERAVEANPDNPKLIEFLARCHESAGEIQKAVEGYRQVVELKPEDAESVVRLARTHARMQR